MKFSYRVAQHMWTSVKKLLVLIHFPISFVKMMKNYFYKFSKLIVMLRMYDLIHIAICL